jgi:hypothetical protein
LSECRHRGDSHQCGEDSIDSVCENATLDTRIEQLAFDIEPGNIAGSGDISDSLASTDDEDCHQWKDEGTIDLEFESVYPDEGC